MSYQLLIFKFIARVKSFELRKKNREELLKQVTDLKNELAQHRVAKVTAGAPSKLAKMYVGVFIYFLERYAIILLFWLFFFLCN